MYQERDALKRLLPTLASAYDHFAPRRLFEVILVDDGSTDHSFEIAHAWAEHALFPVKVLRLNPNEGIGGALRCGMKFATARVAVTYDADMTYPIEDIDRLMDAIDAGADVVTASPFHPDGSALAAQDGRVSISTWAHWCYKIRLGKKLKGITCVTCGFRAYRREILDEIIHRHDGFLATAELLVRALLAGLKVTEVPSTLSERQEGESKMKVFRTALSHLAFLVTLR
ncbi:MAG: dolichol-phosphate mannosyltransferase [Planctomycetota bacterium]|jgi:dolichol-phosphate mannosyltransferase